VTRDDPADPEVGSALAATRAQLAAEPEITVPPEIAARWVAAVADDSAAAHRTRRSTGPGRPVPARPMRRRWTSARSSGVLGAAVASVAVLAGMLLVPTPGSDVLHLARIDLAAAGAATVGATDTGALAAPQRRAACLRSVGVAAGSALLGGRRVLLDGRPGLLLVLGTGELGRFRVVVVDPACGPDGGVLIAESTIGR